MEKEVEKYLDQILVDFFPKNGEWMSNCFEKSDVVDEKNLPCHLRDNNWLADLILKKYDLYSLGKEKIMEYLINSKSFNKLRHDYEQKIVLWQIYWMKRGGGNWLGEELFVISPECDHAFRKGVVDTLSVIGMNKDAIEEGIEKNADKWREGYMRIAFQNIYSRNCLNLDGSYCSIIEEPSQEHYENWKKLRLYEYYIEHKDSVDRYGIVLPEMKITDKEVIDLKKWLENAHEERMKKIEENDKEKEKLKCQEEPNLEKCKKSKSLIMSLFRRK